jgi:hypothetical protein
LLRVETEGAFIELSEYVLDEFLIPDPAKLNKSECRRLIEVFDKIKRVEFPCILDQLRNKHSSRRLIDTTWLKILGYKSDVNAFLDRLYDSLANEIELLKRIMAEGETLEDSEESE